VNTNNILVKIAQEDDNKVVSPAHIHLAIEKGIPKADIFEAIVDILAENTGCFYMEDAPCCAFVAMRYDIERKCFEDRETSCLKDLLN